MGVSAGGGALIPSIASV